MGARTGKQSIPDTALSALIVIRNAAFYFVDWALSVLQSQPRRQRNNVYLKGNFAPTDKEVHETDLKVIGTMPKDLNGVFIRTGPNNYFRPTGDYHWFDGDGMLHACRIKDGRVSYSNRYVRTHKLEKEKEMGDLRGLPGVLRLHFSKLKNRMGVIDTKRGAGTANTALITHARKLLSLQEADLPYAIRVMCDGLIETLGRVEFDGKVEGPITAHPKPDPRTGELFYIGYDVAGCKVNYGALDANGEPTFSLAVPLPDPVMMHDMATTEDWAILLDCPLIFKGDAMVKENRLPVVFDKARGTRLGVLPKRNPRLEDVRWFEMPGFMIFHVLNAWQEGSTIRLFACILEDFDLDLEAWVKVQGDRPEEQPSARLNEVTLNLASGKATRRLVAPTQGDFPRVPMDKMGLKTRYGYIATFDVTKNAGIFVGVTKIDLADNNLDTAVVGQINYGLNRYAGDAIFVPSSNPTSEDDGYLMTYLHDETPGIYQSELVVYNAKTMSNDPVARVVLPHRVPYGFHCHHMNEEEFQDQVTAL